jgi:hypothetical protein
MCVVCSNFYLGGDVVNLIVNKELSRNKLIKNKDKWHKEVVA